MQTLQRRAQIINTFWRTYSNIHNELTNVANKYIPSVQSDARLALPHYLRSTCTSFVWLTSLRSQRKLKGPRATVSPLTEQMWPAKGCNRSLLHFYTGTIRKDNLLYKCRPIVSHLNCEVESRPKDTTGEKPAFSIHCDLAYCNINLVVLHSVQVSLCKDTQVSSSNKIHKLQKKVMPPIFHQ